MKRRNMPRAKRRRQMAARQREIAHCQALLRGDLSTWRKVDVFTTTASIKKRLASAQAALDKLEREQP